MGYDEKGAIAIEWTKKDRETIQMLKKKVGDAQAQSVMDKNPSFAPPGAMFVGQGDNKLIMVDILTGTIMVVGAEPSPAADENPPAGEGPSVFR